MKNSLSETFRMIRGLIENGDVESGRLLLANCSRRNRLARPARLIIAGLAREILAPESGVRALHPIVRSGHSRLQATPEELAEYGICLAIMEATQEAIEILSAPELHSLPRVVNYLALANFRNWDWPAAIPWLERHLRIKTISEADRRVAELRLGTALLHGKGDVETSARIFEVLIRECESGARFVSPWDAVIMRAQTHFLAKEWGQGRAVLKRLEPFQKSDLAVAPELKLWAALWRLLLDLGERGSEPALVAQLRGLKAKMQEHRRWEWVRSCDYYEALLFGDRALLTHLYFGTPYPGFRRKILALMSEKDLPQSYERRMGVESGDVCLAIATGATNTGKHHFLKTGQVVQKTLAALASDFYRPPRIAELHERVFPGQHFNPDSSPLKIRQAIMRLRQWLGAADVPLVVDSAQGWYTLNGSDGCQLLYDRELPRHAGVSNRPLLEKLRGKGGKSAFSAAQAASWLKLSLSTVTRLLRQGIGAGELQRSGKGSSTQYRFTSN